MSKLISSIYKSPQIRRQVYEPPIKVENRPVMVFCETRQRYEVYNSYSIHIWLKVKGFYFDGKQRCWWTISSSTAEKAGKYACPELKNRLIKLKAATHKRIKYNG